MRNFWSRGSGNKISPLDWLGHPVHLLGGEFGKQDLYVSNGGPLGGLRVLLAVRLSAEHKRMEKDI